MADQAAEEPSERSFVAGHEQLERMNNGGIEDVLSETVFGLVGTWSRSPR